jgi:hypothetical protein
MSGQVRQRVGRRECLVAFTGSAPCLTLAIFVTMSKRRLANSIWLSCRANSLQAGPLETPARKLLDAKLDFARGRGDVLIQRRVGSAKVVLRRVPPGKRVTPGTESRLGR